MYFFITSFAGILNTLLAIALSIPVWIVPASRQIYWLEPTLPPYKQTGCFHQYHLSHQVAPHEMLPALFVVQTNRRISRKRKIIILCIMNFKDFIIYFDSLTGKLPANRKAILHKISAIAILVENATVNCYKLCNWPNNYSPNDYHYFCYIRCLIFRSSLHVEVGMA